MSSTLNLARTATPSTAAVDFPEHRISTERYLKMIEVGVFEDGDRLFLWHGRLVEKMTKGRPHSFAALKLDDLLGRIISVDLHLELEQPMVLSDDTMPEPDLMVIRGPLDDYRNRMPTPRDIPLIVEVADSSVGQDRGPKLLDSASAEIPVYWLVNIPKRRIEVYSQPSGPAEVPGYADHVEYEVGSEVPVILDGREVGRIVVGQIIP